MHNSFFRHENFVFRMIFMDSKNHSGNKYIRFLMSQIYL